MARTYKYLHDFVHEKEPTHQQNDRYYQTSPKNGIKVAMVGGNQSYHAFQEIQNSWYDGQGNGKCTCIIQTGTEVTPLAALAHSPKSFYQDWANIDHLQQQYTKTDKSQTNYNIIRQINSYSISNLGMKHPKFSDIVPPTYKTNAQSMFQYFAKPIDRIKILMYMAGKQSALKSTLKFIQSQYIKNIKFQAKHLNYLQQFYDSYPTNGPNLSIATRLTKEQATRYENILKTITGQTTDYKVAQLLQQMNTKMMTEVAEAQKPIYEDYEYVSGLKEFKFILQQFPNNFDLDDFPNFTILQEFEDDEETISEHE